MAGGPKREQRVREVVKAVGMRTTGDTAEH
jgi:hypothetical protein